MSVDPITLEVVRGRLGLIAEQMQVAMIRSAYSTIVKESGDVAAALFDNEGELIGQASGVPILLGATVPAVAAVLRFVSGSEFSAGDVFLLNDPYDGGTHLPDLITVAPIVAEAQLLGFACIVAHHIDLGGKSAGSLPVDATDIFQEGLRIPAVRLVRAGEMDAQLIRVILANSRFPSELRGDIDAQLSACRIGVETFVDLARGFGADLLQACVRELVTRSEILTQEALAAVPSGTYLFADNMDNDGVDLDRPLHIAVAVTIQAGRLTFDFEGTCPQTRGPFNASPSTVLAAVYYVLRCVTGSSIPTNGGCFRAIDLRLPAGSLVNPILPAAVNARSMTFGIIVDVLFGALAQAMPDRVPAASYEYANVTFGGVDPATGKAFVVNETACGGLGARPFADGLDVFRSKAGNSLNTPVEALETDTPLRVLSFGLRKDSGGAGRYRGGLGCSKTFELLRGEITVSHRGDRHRSGPYGLDGGLQGAPSVSRLVTSDVTNEIPSKLVFRMQAGDKLEFETAGGGGHGPPQMRSREWIEADLRDGKISPQAALHDYGAPPLVSAP